jgi:hypothetical protein
VKRVAPDGLDELHQPAGYPLVGVDPVRQILQKRVVQDDLSPPRLLSRHFGGG